MMVRIPPSLPRRSLGGRSGDRILSGSYVNPTAASVLPGFIALETSLLFNPENDRITQSPPDAQFWPLYQLALYEHVRPYHDRLQEWVRGRAAHNTSRHGPNYHSGSLLLLCRHDDCRTGRLPRRHWTVLDGLWIRVTERATMRCPRDRWRHSLTIILSHDLGRRLVRCPAESDSCGGDQLSW